jgi:hypothetical protein
MLSFMSRIVPSQKLLLRFQVDAVLLELTSILLDTMPRSPVSLKQSAVTTSHLPFVRRRTVCLLLKRLLSLAIQMGGCMEVCPTVIQ